ncbi:germination protein KC [Halobacillus andaensis]|uniref:Germination protein KC n=1 Tax=Halobacillus andaensis TaxID=1176239 RepID=A0A917EWU5_HALAA|nr:Ger(x)C family spore germination protein [Halobacillus andaensis]MBP2004217.1 Ger(x)C family germination protein [Halobacillus andaensis]GGF16700.1 germination protein KC [Halobacillus andaensis]
MKRLCLIFLVSMLTLTGCWDQRQFKNIKLALSIGVDQGSNGEIVKTVSVPTVSGGGDGGQINETIQTLSTDGHTMLEARDKIDRMLAHSFNPSKMEVVILGEDIAKKDIYPILDNYYRNPNSNLNAHLAIAEGEAKDVLSFKGGGEARISEYLKGILDGAAAASRTTGENLQMICAELVEDGEDFTVPLIKLNEDDNTIKFNGLGLMSGDRYSGVKLSAEQAPLLMLMMGNKGRVAQLTKKVNEHQKEEILDYITVEVMKYNKDLKIHPSEEEVRVDIVLDLDVRVIEYPHDHLVSEKVIDDLNGKLKETLTTEAEEIFSVLQEGNSDVFAIGRKIQAYHPKVWEKLDWEEMYPEVQFNPEINVTIQQHGIVN